MALEDLWGRAGREAGERAGHDPVALAAALRARLATAAPDPRVRAAAGYADQAHMTRELGALAGRTPAALRTA